jgi:hypothetical protein
MKRISLILLAGMILSGCLQGGGVRESDKPSDIMEERGESTVERRPIIPERRIEPLTRGEIEAFMERWIKVYNTHTFDTYVRMYDRETFVGVKRPTNGKKNTYDYDGWVDNKRNEFRKFKPEVIMNDLRITNLNEKGSSKVSFEQIWVSYKGSYADKGEKVMTLRKINGEIKITYEELLYSEPANEYLYEVGD